MGQDSSLAQGSCEDGIHAYQLKKIYELAFEVDKICGFCMLNLLYVKSK